MPESFSPSKTVNRRQQRCLTVEQDNQKVRNRRNINDKSIVWFESVISHALYIIVFILFLRRKENRNEVVCFLGNKSFPQKPGISALQCLPLWFDFVHGSSAFHLWHFHEVIQSSPRSTVHAVMCRVRPTGSVRRRICYSDCGS